MHLLNILSPLFIYNLLFASNTREESEAYEKWSSSLLSIIFYLPLMRLSSWCAVYISAVAAYACTYYTSTAPLHMYIICARGRCESKICPSFSRRRVSQIEGISPKKTHTLTPRILYFLCGHIRECVWAPCQPPGPVSVRAILCGNCFILNSNIAHPLEPLLWKYKKAILPGAFFIIFASSVIIRLLFNNWLLGVHRRSMCHTTM